MEDNKKIDTKEKVTDFFKGLALGCVVLLFTVGVGFTNFIFNGRLDSAQTPTFLFFQSLIFIFGGVLFFVFSIYFFRKRKRFVFFGLIIPLFLFLLLTGGCMLG